MNTLNQTSATVETLDDLAPLADYSFMDTLNSDPEAKANGVDHDPRQVFSGHYVPVNPTPIKDPVYIAHSKNFFNELGFADSLAQSPDFVRMFSETLHRFRSLCEKLVGQQDMPFPSTAPNTTSSVHLIPVMATVMAVPFPSLRL